MTDHRRLETPLQNFEFADLGCFGIKLGITLYYMDQKKEKILINAKKGGLSSGCNSVQCQGNFTEHTELENLSGCVSQSSLKSISYNSRAFSNMSIIIFNKL